MRAGAGSEAVAVPFRTVPIRVRRVVANDRCRGWTGWPVRGLLVSGPATAAAERVSAGEFGGGDPGGVFLMDQHRGARSRPDHAAHICIPRVARRVALALMADSSRPDPALAENLTKSNAPVTHVMDWPGYGSGWMGVHAVSG